MNKFLNAESEEESFRLLHEDDKKDYDDLYKEAYKSFSIENYKMALVHFIKLKTLKPEEIKFDMKIAECYFNIPYYTKTIEKCDEIMNNKEIYVDEKFLLNSLNLKLKSLLKLKRIEQAQNIINEKKELINKNNGQFFEIEEEIKRKMKNIRGEIDLSEIYEKAKENFNVDIGEYVNSKLEIKYDKNKGISVYSKEKINKGEILVVSKAIMAINLLKKKEDKSMCIQFYNPHKDEYEKTSFPLVFNEKSDLEDILAYKISNYPEDFDELLYLFNGKNNNLNIEDRYKSKEIDLKKLQKIMRFNTKTILFNEIPLSRGIWYYPSFFNHSCIPNCYEFGFGDILIIIAVNSIEKNKELYLNYLMNDLPYEMRQTKLKERFDFICNCELCNYEKSKFKECPEKKVLNEYLFKLYNYIFPEESEKGNEIAHICEKEVKDIIKFLEKNKKSFSCYEKSGIYVKCAFCIKIYDGYLSYDYLEKALKYSENRNFYYEKESLQLLIYAAKYIKSDARLETSIQKIKDFYNKYFPNQKKFVDILINTANNIYNFFN